MDNNLKACEVPLLELMAAVPPNTILRWTDADGLQASHTVPVGKYLHDAIHRIRELEGSLFKPGPIQFMRGTFEEGYMAGVKDAVRLTNTSGEEHGT